MSARPAQRSPDTRGVAFTIDALTGRLLLECRAGVPQRLLEELERLVGAGKPLACAVPTAFRTLLLACPDELASQPTVRIAGYWHDSLIEGPGRRSVVKLVGCPIHCHNCITPESWDMAGGYPVPVNRLADALLDPVYQRDGISVLGGEPFAQPEGLLALVRALRDRGCGHILCYSGYTYERLRRMACERPAIGAVLDEIAMLVDGPFIDALVGSAGPWTGSGNQRVIDLVATQRAGRLVVVGTANP